jgi:hypothetical protein
MTWYLLAGLAMVALVFYWNGPNALWGGVSIGFVGGVLVSLVALLLGRGFRWTTIGKGIVVGILLGLLAELLPAFVSQVRRARHHAAGTGAVTDEHLQPFDLLDHDCPDAIAFVKAAEAEVDAEGLVGEAAFRESLKRINVTALEHKRACARCRSV